MFLFTKRSKLLLQNFQSKQVLVTMKSTMLSKGSCPHPYRTPPALPSLHCREIQTYNLHSSSETAASYPKSHERNIDVAKENATVGLNEEDIEEEPIDHLLEVKKVSQYPASLKILKKFSNTFEVISQDCMHFVLSSF